MKSLDEIFAPDTARSEDARADGQPAAEPSPQPEPEPGEQPAQSEDKPDQPRDEAGRFAPKQTDPAQAETTAPPAEAKPEPATVPREALQDERRKRQELEQRLAELERRYAQPQQPAAQPQQPPKPADPPKGFWDDPEGFIAQREATLRHEMLLERVNLSVAAAKQRHADYDAAEALFDRAVDAQARQLGVDRGQAPLAQMALRQPDPAAFVYQTAARIREQAKTPEEREAEINARVEAEVARRLAQQNAAPPAAPPRPQLPGTLADARAAPGGNRQPAQPGHRPLSAIFG